MRFRKAILLALSLGFGLSYAFPALATKNGDTKVEITKNTTRGVQNGQPGALVEQIKKTYTWSEPDLSALRTFIGANGLVQAPLDRIFQNLAQPMPSPYFQNVANGGTVASFPGWGPTSTAMDSNSNMYAIEGGSYSGSGLVFKKIDAKGNVTQIPVPPEFKISPYYCELTTDSEGNVYLPEEKYQNSAPGNTFCKYDPKTGKFTEMTVPGAQDIFKVVADRDGTLYASDHVGQKIYKIEKDGSSSSFDMPGGAMDIAFDEAGNMMTVGWWDGKVRKVNKETGAITDTIDWGSKMSNIIGDNYSSIVPHPDGSFHVTTVNGTIYQVKDGKGTIVGQAGAGHSHAVDASGAIYGSDGKGNLVKTILP